MKDIKKGSFDIQTEKNKFKIDYYFKFIEKDKIKTNKLLFEKMCKDGCMNYNKKYSCPPFSPDFKTISKNYEGLFVVMFLCNLNQISSTEYNKVRIANIVMKSRLDNLMRKLEKTDLKYLSTGSCRLCKPCQCKVKKPCKHPDKKRYSLESVGIDCNDLTKILFKIPLKWYKDKKSPEYTSVLCGLPCDKKDVDNVGKSFIQLMS